MLVSEMTESVVDGTDINGITILLYYYFKFGFSTFLQQNGPYTACLSKPIA